MSTFVSSLSIPSFPELVIRMRESAQELDDDGCDWTHDGTGPDGAHCDCDGLREDSCEHGKTAAREMRRVADRIRVAALSLAISAPPNIAGARKMLEEASEIEREFGDDPIAKGLLSDLDAAEMFASARQAEVEVEGEGEIYVSLAHKGKPLETAWFCEANISSAGEDGLRPAGDSPDCWVDSEVAKLVGLEHATEIGREIIARARSGQRSPR